MSEQQLQFRVGLFVTIALLLGVYMTFQFGKLQQFFEPKYYLAVHYPNAPGLLPGVPVRQNGILIGSVDSVSIDEEHGGAIVVVSIKESHKLRTGSQPRLVRSLLGDTSIEFTLGKGDEMIVENEMLEGLPADDPMKTIDRLESNVSMTLSAFTQTTEEWGKLARNLNGLMETKEGDINTLVQQAGTSLSEVTQTLKQTQQLISHTNNLIDDPQLQASLKQTMTSMPRLVSQTEQTLQSAQTVMQTAHHSMEGLPDLVSETRQAVGMAKQTITQMSHSMTNLEQATAPLAEQSQQLLSKLDGSIDRVDTILADVQQFSAMLANGKGSLHQLSNDDELYRNLNHSSESLAILLYNLQPITRDLQILSDKLARHPELLGISGAIRGSDGLKDEAETIQQAGYEEPARFPADEYRPSGNSVNIRVKRK